ncbi:FtsQ-type POTRA domain-containing protein [Nocardioides sp.]|uniref:cell division protein FtsQ/DivIB n=1 Tax=Nocardioides sp. TaxID=35761 RepID=UPI001A33BC24|nr:FtsQ-type POTRA domain-containing protein [Nocardioides sp.]MBJ7357911.1 FtsQ-type POTRA domain-containing protein [Nocardioides sp.]
MPEPRLDPATARSRRRFARRQWRRRWLAWRFVVVLVLLLALVGAGGYAVWFSSWLDVEKVDVSGAQNVAADEVRTRSQIEDGTPLARVDLVRAEARVRSLAIVKEVRVSRQWPDTVLIEIVERVAIAVVEIGGRLRGMDADGVVFRDYNRAPPGLPRVQTDIGTSAEALGEAAEVISALPESLARIVDYVQVATVDEISLFLKDGRQVVWGSAEDSETKARVAIDLLQKVDARVYDVSVPTQATTS